ncbi:hypothetical protein, partial [Staphylococcus aureus]
LLDSSDIDASLKTKILDNDDLSLIEDESFYDELAEFFENLDNMSDTDLGEYYIDMIGGIDQLDKQTLRRYLDYDKLGYDLAFDYTYIVITTSDGETICAWVRD